MSQVARSWCDKCHPHSTLRSSERVGSAAKRTLRNLVRMADVNVIAASSRSQQSLDAAVAIAGPATRTFTDWRDVLAIDAVDAVIIALTNDQHHETTVAAFAAGKHVFVEKPMGLNIAQCNDIINASQAAGKLLQVGHELRFQRLYVEMKRLIDAGEIGELQLMWCREFRGPMRDGWRSSEAQSGGVLLEKCVHHFDLCNWIMDRPPLRVAAQGGRNVVLHSEGLDNAQVIIEFEGGRRASLELCLFAPFGGDSEIGVAGSNGRIDTANQALTLTHQRYEPRQQTSRKITELDEEETFIDASGRIDRGIRAELVHFVDAVRNNRQPMNSGASGKLACAVSLAAQESIHRQQAVTIEEILG